MYTKIVVPLDGSQLAEQILPFARWLSEANNIPLELLTVTAPDVRPPILPAKTGEGYLQKVRQNYLAGLPRVTTAIERGMPAEAIMDHAKNDPDCLIGLATHGTSGVRRWLLGSVASKLVQTAGNPLLLVRPVEGVHPLMPVALKTIFVPLDGSGLAEKVLPHVAELAKAMKLEVHLIRVYTLPTHAYVVAEGVIAQGPGQFRQELQKEAETYLEGKAEQLRLNGLNHVVTTSLEGDPASEINDIARKTTKSLVAMSTHGRSGIGRWMLGSVAEKVVQHSTEPVLVIRPT